MQRTNECGAHAVEADKEGWWPDAYMTAWAGTLCGLGGAICAQCAESFCGLACGLDGAYTTKCATIFMQQCQHMTQAMLFSVL